MLKTVVMTDVAGFTETVRNNQPQALASLKVDIDLIRDHITSNDGEVIKVAGDGVLALFSSAQKAVRACIDAQSALVDSPLRHRMAIHAGEITLTEGDAYGDAVNVCSRLETITTPGTVTASRIVIDLIEAQGLPDPIRKGKVQLKGIDGSVEVFSWGPGGRFPRNRTVSFAAAMFLATIAICGGFLAFSLRGEAQNLESAINAPIRRMFNSVESKKDTSFDEMMDQAYDDVWQEIDDYEVTKIDAVKRVDADSVIKWLETNPLGKRERGRLELEHWGLVKKAIDKGRQLAGPNANADQIWQALQKHEAKDYQLEMKAFAEEFRQGT